MPPLRFLLTGDAEEFARRTERLLSAHLECNVLATVLRTVLEGSHRDPAPVFAIGVTEAGEVSFAAMRTPPFPLLVSPIDPGLAEAMIDRWLQHDPDVPAVSGPLETARAIAAAWSRRTGGTARRTFSEGVHVLDEVRDPPRPAPGTLRLPGPDERDLLVRWVEEFIGETGLIGGAQAASMVDARLRQQGLLVWDDGQPVSLVGVNPAVAGVARVGPVYTPRPLRRRGYAGSAVAAASRRALAGGAARCMLYTDLTNPTSNKIYAEVGYRRSGDWEEIALERALERE